MVVAEWKPQIGEKFIWQNRATLTCLDRVIQAETGKRCLIGRNVTGSGYLDGELLNFEECRPYWEPVPGDQVKLAVDWFTPRLELGKPGKCLGYAVDSCGVRLARVIFDDGIRRDFQPIWFLPTAIASHQGAAPLTSSHFIPNSCGAKVYLLPRNPTHFNPDKPG